MVSHGGSPTWPGGQASPAPARVPRDIAAMDNPALQVLAAEQREEITYLRLLLRVPWWWHAAVAAGNKVDRLREHLTSLAAWLADRRRPR